MHPPTYVCTHISVYKTIIEDKKLLCNQSTKYFIIAKNKSLLKLRHRYNRLWENNILYTTSCLPRDYSRGDQDGVAVDDDEHAGGGMEPTGGDSGSISLPPNSSFDNLLSFCFFVFDLHTVVLR
jgi:hypothetical protein